MLCYLAGMEPYYLKCIKDGPFQPKTAKGAIKPESQWTQDERRVVVQDQRLKSIIMSCLPNDILELVISCKTTKATWTDLVHSFEGPSDTKKNRIMDLKLEYQTLRAKLSKSLSQTYTRYKTLLNELANDGVNLSKHEINVGFVNSLPEKWLNFSQGLRNANHTHTLDLTDIYGRSSEEYLRDLDIEFYERALLANSKSFLKSLVSGSYSVSKGFQPKFTPKLIQSSQSSSSQAEPKIQKDYKAEYKKIKAKLALFEAKVSDDEEVTEVKVNILLSIDEDADWQNYLKYINIDLKFVEERILVPESQAVNESLKPTEGSSNPESSKDSKVESITPLPAIKNLQGASPSLEMLIDEKVNFTQNTQESKPQIQQTKSSKSVDSSKISQDFKPKVQNSNSSKSLRPKPIQKPQLKCELCHYTNHSTEDSYRILYCMICKKEDHRTSNHEMYTSSLKRSENYKAQLYLYACPSKQILKAKAKPFPP
ncbi:hypothetical protein Tco_0748454 [Tanacetum coccineum]|uniref:Retrovirus-related Pol polyprotein from transposon TNT 1-94 n=1 Tax=Tanacetum coccineum TaxID=301880 RepID=A0ABQ4YVT0_9ASTR